MGLDPGVHYRMSSVSKKCLGKRQQVDAYSRRGLAATGVRPVDLRRELALARERGEENPVDVRSSIWRGGSRGFGGDDEGVLVALSRALGGEIPLGIDACARDGVGDIVVLACKKKKMAKVKIQFLQLLN
jgi:hypothetical protein